MSLPILLQASTVIGFLVLIYIVYYRYFNPLAKYPGPPLASVTNLWKTYHLGTCISRTRLFVYMSSMAMSYGSGQMTCRFIIPTLSTLSTRQADNYKRRGFMMDLRLSIPTCLEHKMKRFTPSGVAKWPMPSPCSPSRRWSILLTAIS